MSSATETLCGQAFGAKQYYMMGIFLQRSWLVDLAALTILLPFFFFSTPIFRLLGQDAAIAESAGHISLWFIPFCYSLVFGLTVQMFLQAQQKNLIVAYLSVLQFAAHIPLSWLFVSHLKLGVGGAMAALCISQFIVVFGEFIYVFGGWCPDSWHGFKIITFKWESNFDEKILRRLLLGFGHPKREMWSEEDLGLKKLYACISLEVCKCHDVANSIMIGLEVWYYAILVFAAGYMKNAEVAISAFSVCLNINGWEFGISLGFLGAACVRVANELGRGDAKAVSFSIKVLLSTSTLIGLAFWILCMVFGNRIGYIFTEEEAVAKGVTDLSLLLALLVLFNSIYPIFSGVAVGAGMQATVAIINVVCFYLIGFPVGLVLGYVTKLQVKGLWIGMLCGVITETIALGFLMWRTNWGEEVLKASARLKNWHLKSPDEANQSVI